MFQKLHHYFLVTARCVGFYVIPSRCRLHGREIFNRTLYTHTHTHTHTRGGDVVKNDAAAAPRINAAGKCDRTRLIRLVYTRVPRYTTTAGYIAFTHTVARKTAAGRSRHFALWYRLYSTLVSCVPSCIHIIWAIRLLSAGYMSENYQNCYVS